MTLTLGICDDVAEHNELLAQLLRGYPHGPGFAIVQCTQPETFLALLAEQPPQLVFLDIDMGAVGGIELGKAIKARYGNVVLIYITAHEKYALDAFGVRAYHYLLKPVTTDTLYPVLTEALRHIEQSAQSRVQRQFTIRKKGELITLPAQDIRYFEKSGHKILAYTAAGCVDFYGNFADLLGQLDDGSFLQCHQGYVANLERVRGFRDRMLFLEGGLQLPVSRSYVENVRQKLARRLFGAGGQL